MIPMDEVMKLNNESVLRLTEGNDQMAVGMLSKCVALMRTNLVCSGRQENQLISSSSSIGRTAGSANHTPSQLRTGNGDNWGTSNSLLQEPKNEKAHQLGQCQNIIILHKESLPLKPLNNREGEGGCYIYNHLLLFAPHDKEDISLSAHHSTTTTNECTVRVQISVVIFNLALIHHLRGRLGNFHSLTTAFRLYYMASQLLTENCILTNETAAVVKLGAVNNMFQIRYEEQGNLEDAQKILQFLSSLMRGSYANPDNLLSLDRHDYRGFMTNVLLLQPPKFAPAA